MKYLMKYNDFNESMVGNMEQQTLDVDDQVKLSDGNIAKIVKLNSKNSYIVHIMQNHAFVPKPIEVSGEDIIEIVKSNSSPAMGSDIMQKSQTDPNNSMVINGGYPDTPLSNVMNY